MHAVKKIIRRAVDEGLRCQLPDIHPVLQRVYIARGVQSSSDIEHSLNALLPFESLKNIDRAAQYLAKALVAQKRILIIGDFDADGATSAVLAVTALRLFGFKEVTYLVPNRFEYGYGLTPEIVKVAAKWQPDVLITVDNGIASVEGVAVANEMGMEVVITDHHLPGDELPQAVAIINPNQVGDEFPSKNLAGVGVAFYLMVALRRTLCDQNWFAEQGTDMPNLAQLLDLVALGTVADVVPLDKNNRILIQQGLQQIRQGKCRPGILALLDIAGRDRASLVAGDLAYAIAPRLNAAGRLKDMSLGIECLLCDDMGKAHEMALQLDELNLQRRAIETEMQAQAVAQLQQLNLAQESLPAALCLYRQDWHQGVVGILAGRLKDQWQRPAIAFAQVTENELKGSARSVGSLNIRDILDAIAKKNPGLILKFGGHAMAAGLSIEPQNFERFREAFIAEVAGAVGDNPLGVSLLTDGQLDSEDFKLPFAFKLRDSGPWGQQFPEPIFDGEFAIVEQYIVAEKHLKLKLAVPGSQQAVAAIAFNIDLDQWPNHECTQLKAAYRLDVNMFRGTSQLQLIIDYLEPCASA